MHVFNQERHGKRVELLHTWSIHGVNCFSCISPSHICTDIFPVCLWDHYNMPILIMRDCATLAILCYLEWLISIVSYSVSGCGGERAYHRQSQAGDFGV